MISTQNDPSHTNSIMLTNLTYQIINKTTFLCFTSSLVQYHRTKESNPTLCILSVGGPPLVTPCYPMLMCSQYTENEKDQFHPQGANSSLQV